MYNRKMLELTFKNEIIYILRWCIISTTILISIPILSLIRSGYITSINRIKKEDYIKDFKLTLASDELSKLSDFKVKNKYINELIYEWNNLFNHSDELTQSDLQLFGENKKVQKWLLSSLNNKKINNANSLEICNAIHMVGNLALYKTIDEQFNYRLRLLTESNFTNISLEAIVALLKTSKEKNTGLCIKILIDNSKMLSREINIVCDYVSIDEARTTLGQMISHTLSSKRQNKIIDIICGFNDVDYYLDYILAEKSKFSSKNIAKLIHYSKRDVESLVILDDKSFEVRNSLLNKLKREPNFSFKCSEYIRDSMTSENVHIRNIAKNLLLRNNLK